MRSLWKRVMFVFVTVLGVFLVARVNPIFSQNPPQNTGERVSRSGAFSLLWGDGKSFITSSQLVFSLIDDKGSPTEVVIPEALQKKSGGILALDRRHLQIKGQLKSLQVKGKTTQVLEAETIQPLTGASDSPVLGEVKGAVIGSQPWVNILCKFQDIATEPKSLSYVQDLFSSTRPGLNHYWRESSYDQVNIDGTSTVGWYTLPNIRTYYTSLGASQMLTKIFDDCVAAANVDVFFPNYLGVNIMVNSEMDGSAWGGSRYATLDGVSRFWYTTWEPPWGYGNQTVLAHEMGHGFGLPHSSGDYGYTYDNRWDVMSDDWSNCTRSTNPTFGCLGQHTISFHKDRLQWIPVAEKQTVSTGTQTVTLEQLALPQTANKKMIVLPIGGSQTLFYTVEVRRWTGYDVKLPGEAVIIHNVDTTRLNPAHVVDIDGNGNTGDAGAMWTVGEIFTDVTNGITVSIDSMSSSGYIVTVANNSGSMPTPVSTATPTPSPVPFLTPTPSLVPTPTPTPLQIPGDANGDGKVDSGDYAIWLVHYDQPTLNRSSDGDFNGDGIVDGVDYIIWLTYYGT